MGGSSKRAAERYMGRCLWRERQLAGLSRAALGALAGLSDDTVRRYELGEERIIPPDLAQIATTLRLPLSAFSRSEEEEAPRANPAAVDQVSRIAVRRPLSLLASPAFAQARRLLELWHEHRGELGEEVLRGLTRDGLSSRVVLVRNPAGGERLITQHLGPGIRIMRPCDALYAVERDFAEHHADRDYAAWVAAAYAETLWRRQPRLDSVRASVRAGAATKLKVRYDRLIMPWVLPGKDRLAMTLSIQREAPTLTS